jgi:hypothetical protein
VVERVQFRAATIALKANEADQEAKAASQRYRPVIAELQATGAT